MIKMWNSFPEILIMDSTYCITNGNCPINWKLFTILSLNYIGETEVVCTFLAVDKTIDTLHSVFSKLVSFKRIFFGGTSTIFTDKHISERNVLKISFLNPNTTLCIRHAHNAVHFHLNKKIYIKLTDLTNNQI